MTTSDLTSRSTMSWSSPSRQPKRKTAQCIGTAADLVSGQAGSTAAVDIEDLVLDESPITHSPFEQFRKKGWLSVSDLVGTVWCEVQVRSLGVLYSGTPVIVQYD